jgi:hypothetical protein
LSQISRYVRRHHIGLLALFVAFSGTAYAANQVGSNDIAKNAVKSRHVAANTLRSQDLRNGAAVTGADVRPESIGGGQIDESSLGKVPSAGNADSASSAGNAGLLDGLDSSALQRPPRWALVAADGTIEDQSGGVQVAFHDVKGTYILDFNAPVRGKLILGMVAYEGANDLGDVHASACGPGELEADCGGEVPGADGSGEHVLAFTAAETGVGGNPDPFYLAVFP